ncbi:MAG: calcium-binding protein [Candidatus Caenarcaniphilales bacterium]|nr:calcium-binding protein [Candidatus Caenarcaniphilales bacterium]
MATFIGTNGNDVFVGQDLPVSNTFNGQGGSDTLTYAESRDDIEIDLGNREIYNGNSTDFFSNIERIIAPEAGGGYYGFFFSELDFSNVMAADFTSATKGINYDAVTNKLTGFNGVNFISGFFYEIEGSDRDDVIKADGSGYQYLYGNGGNDILHGRGGIDEIYGGDGNDKIYGGAGEDYIEGDNGDDQIFGGAGDDYIYDEEGDDFMNGGAGNDVYDIDSSTAFGNNTIVDNLGRNLLDISASDDTTVSLIASSSSDEVSNVNGTVNFSQLTANRIFTVFTGSGNDTITGGNKSESLNSGSGNDTVNGGGGNDTIDGGSGDDTLNGDAGNDSIFGNSGNDTIDGGAGNDVLYGGSNDDAYEGFSTSSGKDIISDDSGAADSADFGTILSTAVTFSAQDFDGDGSFDGLRVLINTNNFVDIQNYFDNTVTVASGQGAITAAEDGTGLIESLVFDDATFAIADVVGVL